MHAPGSPELSLQVVCARTQDLVEKHIQQATWNVTDGSPDVGILLLGDSADRNLIYDFCTSAGHEARAQPAAC